MVSFQNNALQLIRFSALITFLQDNWLELHEEVTFKSLLTVKGLRPRVEIISLLEKGAQAYLNMNDLFFSIVPICM